MCQCGLIEETGPARQISDLWEVSHVSRLQWQADVLPFTRRLWSTRAALTFLLCGPSSPSSGQGPPASSNTPGLAWNAGS